MRAISVLIILLVCSPGFAQEEEVSAVLQASKGNLRLSKRFKETPVLLPAKNGNECYRMTFVPTFHNPIKIRIEKHRDQYLLVAKQLSGQGGYDPGQLKLKRSRRLTRKDWQHLQSLLAAAKYWEMPMRDKEPEPNAKGEISICLDGSEWTLEGVSDRKHHFVSRYCSEDKAFNAIGYYFIQLSRLRVNKYEL